MPAGNLKNTLYQLALPILGLRSPIASVQGGTEKENARLCRLLKAQHAVGACIQRFEKGRPTECFVAGNTRMEPSVQPVTAETIFRTASIAKMVTALLVFRLQTLGKLNVCEELSAFLGESVQNPHYPEAPITLGMLLNHTSSIVDSPAYFASFQQPVPLMNLLRNPASYSASLPGLQFRYSNFAAGLIGCLLEKRFHQSFEQLAQENLFQPLGVQATFDLSTLKGKPVADSWRVLPRERCFDAEKRISAAAPLTEDDPERHYLLASGSLFLTAEALAKLALVAWNGHDGFLSPECLSLMQHPTVPWPRQEVCLRHGMGLLKLDDQAIVKKPLWGHQGFAYGAVNGVFFDEEGSGFVCLNSGVSEQRQGHLAVVNRELIRLFFQEEPAHA